MATENRKVNWQVIIPVLAALITGIAAISVAVINNCDKLPFCKGFLVTPEPTQPSVLGGTPSPSSPTESTLPLFTNFRFCAAPCDSPGAHQQSSFPEGVQKIYVRWNYSGMKQGISYGRAWFNRGQNWINYQCTWHGPESGSQEIVLQEPGGLRSGVWDVVITVQDVEAARASVNVAGSFGFWDPAGVQPCPDS